LAGLSIAILVLRVVDLIWLVEPAFSPELTVHWMDLAAPIGIGGIWIAAFVWQLKAQPLLPLNDPRFIETVETQEALEHGTS
jgi:hypothetical protein